MSTKRVAGGYCQGCGNACPDGGWLVHDDDPMENRPSYVVICDPCVARMHEVSARLVADKDRRWHMAMSESPDDGLFGGMQRRRHAEQLLDERIAAAGRIRVTDFIWRGEHGSREWRCHVDTKPKEQP